MSMVFSISFCAGRNRQRLEETAIALILALMTLNQPFINVRPAYGFKHGIIWGFGGSDVSLVRLAVCSA